MISAIKNRKFSTLERDTILSQKISEKIVLRLKMYCPQCQKQIKDDSKYCSKCGAKINLPMSMREKNEPSIDLLMSWLYDLIEIERRIIVVEMGCDDLKKKYRNSGLNRFPTKPEKSVIAQQNSFISELLSDIPLAMLTGLFGGGSAGIIITLFAALFDPVGMDIYWGILTPFFLIIPYGKYILPFSIVFVFIASLIFYVIDGREKTTDAIKQYAKDEEKWYHEVSIIEEKNRFENSKKPAYECEYNRLNTTLEKLNEKRTELYSSNFLVTEYQKLGPVSAIYWYLHSGRCTSLYGHGGAIDTFEHDKQFGILCGKLDTIISQLDDIRDNQRALARAIDKNNAEIKTLRSSLDSFARQQHEDCARIKAYQDYNAKCLSAITAMKVYDFCNRR